MSKGRLKLFAQKHVFFYLCIGVLDTTEFKKNQVMYDYHGEVMNEAERRADAEDPHRRAREYRNKNRDCGCPVKNKTITFLFQSFSIRLLVSTLR